MRTRTTRLILLALPMAAACGGKPLPPAPGAGALVNPRPAPARPGSETAREARATSDPTVLTDDEKARDVALAARASAVPEAFGNFDASLSKDGRRVLFDSDREGVPELYVGDTARTSDAPRKITDGPERVASAQITRDDRYVVFRRDQGADENFRIYRCDIDGRDTVDLTPGETLDRDEPMLPRKRADVMVYTAHEVSSPQTRLFVQSIEGGEPRVVYVEPTPAYGTDVSPDGRRALLERDVSASEAVAIEVDLTTGEARRIYPRAGKRAGIGAVIYSGDGSRIFVSTDEGTERYAVVALDSRTLAEVARYRVDPSTASIAAIEASPRGDLVAVLIDAGTHSEVRVLDARSLASKTRVNAPLGAIQLGPFTDDGKGFTLGESTPDKPADVYVVDAATGIVKPLRDDHRPGLDTLSPLTVSIANVTAFDGLTIPMNVYLPSTADPGQKLPVIAEFHGGPSANAPVCWDPIARFFNSLGYAVVQPNIRGSMGFGRSFEMADNREGRADAMKDVETVNAWIKAQPWADASRVAILGGSYGGYLVLMALGRQPTLWRAGVDACGPSDLRTLLRSQDQTIRSAFVDEFGDLDKDADLLERFSPIRDVDKIRAPLFVYQGENDPRTPRAESDAIVREMRRRAIPVEYMVAADEGHSLARRANLVEFLTRAARFLADRMNDQKN